MDFKKSIYVCILVISGMTAVISALKIAVGMDLAEAPIFRGCFPPTDVFPMTIYRDWMYAIHESPSICLIISLSIISIACFFVYLNNNAFYKLESVDHS